MQQQEYYSSKPNLLRVAREIAKMDHPDRVVNALAQMLAAYARIEPPAPFPEGQTNNERFNAPLPHQRDVHRTQVDTWRRSKDER